MAALTYLLNSLNTPSLKARQAEKSDYILSNAREALLAYTLGRIGTGEWPGGMPIPDYLAETPPVYDGEPDGGCMNASKPNGLPLINNGQNMRCLGRLPWRRLAMLTSSSSQQDSMGEMPWYAVSANLVDGSCMMVNPGMLRMKYQGYVCNPSGANLAHPWLTVRDERGNVVSDRVAFIVILPGPPLGSQYRSDMLAAEVTNYLDTLVVPDNCVKPCVPGTYSNANLDNDYIIPGATQIGMANDRLLYVTIDQLMPLLEKRVVLEVKKALDYPRIYGIAYRPWLLPFRSPEVLANFTWIDGEYSSKGLVPFVICDTSGSQKNCNPNQLYRLRLILRYPELKEHSGTLSGMTLEGLLEYLNYFEDKKDKCTKIDVTIASSNNPNFRCDDTLDTNLPHGVTERVVKINIPSMVKQQSYFVLNNTTHAQRIFLTKYGALKKVLTIEDYDGINLVGEAHLDSIASTSMESLLATQIQYPILPAWYKENEWYRYIYAALAPAYQPGASRSCTEGCLQVVVNGQIKADKLPLIVMSAGVELNQTLLKSGAQFNVSNPAQQRDSANLQDYFDSTNNISESLVFDQQWPLTSMFNDQVVW
ncbi:hypothetical protein LG201_09565 [Methylobacillus gramineus]|uniref:hypothetical protein n=1 Tax=Methylobacillus gramineus TaxID=755169 RepID=UPI001CFFF4B8|nr:hypothetical protein [Methylobacillus gramineus]MCB5185447.1 hypothetical protein [Methylobacillus gramineus]